MLKFPAFAWWANHVLKKRDILIKKVKSRASKKKNMKYGVIIPRNIQDAYALDKVNGNDFWDKAIKKELGNVLIAFKLLEDG